MIRIQKVNIHIGGKGPNIMRHEVDSFDEPMRQLSRTIATGKLLKYAKEFGIKHIAIGRSHPNIPESMSEYWNRAFNRFGSLKNFHDRVFCMPEVRVPTYKDSFVNIKWPAIWQAVRKALEGVVYGASGPGSGHTMQFLDDAFEIGAWSLDEDNDMWIKIKDD